MTWHVPAAEAVRRLGPIPLAPITSGRCADFTLTTLTPSDVTVAEAAELASDVQAVLDIGVRAWCHDGMRERLREVREQYPGEFRDLMTTRASEAVVTDPDAAVGAARQMLQDGLRAGRDTAGQGTEHSVVDTGAPSSFRDSVNSSRHSGCGALA